MFQKYAWIFTIILGFCVLTGCGGVLVSDPDARPVNYPREGVLETNLDAKPLKRPIAAGERVPDFVWVDQVGRRVSTGELMAGGDSLLIFIPGDGDPATRPVYDWVRRNRATASSHQCEILLVSPDSVDTNATVAAREELSVGIMADPSGWGARAFGLMPSGEATRPGRVWSVIVGREGKVLKVATGLLQASEMITTLKVRSAAREEMRAIDLLR